MLKISIKDIIYLILYSIPNTILSFGIVYIINNVISGKEGFLTDYIGIVFISVVVYTYLLNIIFQKKINKRSFEVLYENEKKIFDKILKTSLITLEKLGAQRFYTAIEDLRIFSTFPEVVTHSINSLLMLILCMMYLFTLSVSSALVVIALMVTIAVIYFFVINTMSQKVGNLRKYNEYYYKYVDDVIKGFKGFKLSTQRRDNLMGNHLAPNRENAKELDFKINYVFLSINLISQYGLYLVIGVILFLLPEVGLLKREDVISYVVVLLFISGPINNLINMQNIYTRLMVANTRIKNFLKDFDTVEATTEVHNMTPKVFDSLVFSDISFAYENDTAEKTFALGPINLSIEKGEMIFIIGGNGSGKSTFINILTGLYQPSEGEVILNKQQYIKGNTDTQNLISAVFTDNHIFSQNYDNYSLEQNKEYQELLKIMELDKVILDDKEDSARRPFSKGQSKRMSLIFALLEDKPILVLDEWAADQDPHFRKYFYENLLPKLKQEGKTIIAVTHDDTYFKHADRILKFDYGEIVKDFKVTGDILHTESLWHNEIVS
ncbi:cyclic peptide export ABC transporter [Flavobacterium collinsii]|uniref:ABC transporter ATP-binding/permease protein YojI n=1 Tax=Flavobacterium collinsii TaxID=1114861 RepID=A0A9W4XBI5_9FLAO|nr:cyclic peptide export ABC transporter [Flavobacterium collinsii]GIQ60770.1 ABC transporter ATP-binding protein [Flavobacterium collinsii]CAA9202365.1 ABC transporter ATP-binding/permease protein YojI [Flavobacterium collinsii]CAI2768936.1 cyclic peptide transporter. putative non ribosomal peptide export [Flavobacterium collinsii]